MKKIILTVFAATSLLLYSTPSFALFSVSVGIPMSQTITGKQAGESYGNAPDKTSGYFLAVQLPFALGFGIDSYTTKFKTDGSDGSHDAKYDAGLKTNMTNIFYQLPVPVVNLIIGLGMGTTEMDCTVCSGIFDKGSATQWYTSIGMPLIPLFDIHLSYRSITAKNIKNKETGKKDDNSGSVTGIGIAFNF
jgi:hypothetical protein